MISVIVFDLDGTLTRSKSKIEDDMVVHLLRLLERYMVGIISGGKFEQFETQVLYRLNTYPKKYLENLFIFPTSGGSMYVYDDVAGWISLYKNTLSDGEKDRIYEAFIDAFKITDWKNSKEHFGPRFEDRGNQITFSALGQEAPLPLKKVFDSDRALRKELKAELDKLLPDMEVAIGGTTTIDVTRKGINKAYGIKRLMNYLDIISDNMLFIGDALFEGGNDYPVKETGVHCIQVERYEDTFEVIDGILRRTTIERNR